jgi:hypothetical protein
MFIGAKYYFEVLKNRFVAKHYFYLIHTTKQPRIFAPEKNRSRFLTNVVFLYLNRERIVSENNPDKSPQNYIVTKASLLSSVFHRAWTKYLGILQSSNNLA